jgi:hypothetical protein
VGATHRCSFEHGSSAVPFDWSRCGTVARNIIYKQINGTTQWIQIMASDPLYGGKEERRTGTRWSPSTVKYVHRENTCFYKTYR